jgi:hypothetical protein
LLADAAGGLLVAAAAAAAGVVVVVVVVVFVFVALVVGGVAVLVAPVGLLFCRSSWVCRGGFTPKIFFKKLRNLVNAPGGFASAVVAAEDA